MYSSDPVNASYQFRLVNGNDNSIIGTSPVQNSSTSSNPDLVDLGILSNIPTVQTSITVQMQRVGGSNTDQIGIFCVHIY